MKKTLLLPLLLISLSRLLNAQCIGALNLPTTTDYVQFTNPFYAYTNAITVESWVYMDGTINSTPWLGQATSGVDNMGTNVWHWHGASPNQLSWQVNDGSGAWKAVNSGTMTNGWHHVATVADNASIRIYIDGVLDVTGPAITGTIINNSGSEIHVGHDVRFAAGTAGRNGDYKIGELRVWNVARTPAQISANMSSCLTGSETGLKLYNKFENGAGSSIATSAVGPNGTLVNMTPATNWVSGSGSECCTTASALNFDGTNDYVPIGTVIPLNSSYTKEAWVYANASSSNNIISSSSAAFWLAGGRLSAFNNGGSTIQDPAVFPLNQWVHVVATFNSATSLLSLYKNGILVASGISNSNYTNDPIAIGQYGPSSANFFQGSIDEVRIWNVARTQCEINTYINCEIPAAATNLLANYHFNQGIANANNSTETTLNDVSGNSNNGTLTNFNLNGTTSNWVTPSGVANGYTTTLAPPTITVNSGSIIAGSSFTMVPSGGISYTYSPSGPVVSPTTSATYTVAGANANGCTNTAISSVSVQGTSINFDGTNDYVLVANNALLNFGNSQDFTLEANFKTSFSQPNYAGIIAKANSGTNIGYQLVIYNNRIAAEFTDGTASGLGVGNGLVGTTPLNDNAWHHLAMVVNRSTNNIKLLVDGNIEANVTSPSVSLNVNNAFNMLIGVERGITTYVKGSIDEVRIWNRALCRGEIQNNKNAELPSGQTGLVAYYKMNQGFAALANPGLTTLTDAGGNSLNGTFTNFALTGTTSNWVSPGAVTTGSLAPVFVSPVISVAGASTICAGVATTFTASGNVSTYAWVSGPTTATNTIAPTVNTTYSVVGTNSLGCLSNMATKMLTVNALPIISVNSGAICAGQSFTMIPSGANTYTYSNGSDVVIMPTANATYSVSGTGANGCVSSIDAVSSLTVNALPTILVNSGVICAGQSFTMVPSGATTFTYSNGTDVVTPTADVTYSVSGTDVNGCVSSTDAVSSVTVNALPIISVNSGAICAGQSFTMIPSGASTYSYSNGTDVVSPTADATYSVSGTDVNGCVSSTDAVSSVTVHALPTISINSGAICAGKSFTIVPSGAITYTYSSGSSVVTPTADATYSVSGTDVNGCVSSTDAVSSVTVHALPTISVNSGAICAGKSFTIVPTGASTYTYSSGSAVVTPTVNATYSVNGTDANGCVSLTNATSSVTVKALPIIMASTSNTLLCVGGTATLSAAGATSYTWSTSANTANITVSPTLTTVYSVNGTAANGCVNTTTISQNVSVCAGISMVAEALEATLRVYPNPNNGLFTIELNTSSQIIVTNALGQVIITETLETGKHDLDIHNQCTGVYFVKVIQNDKQQIIKLIKQ